jgi:hypothetical protein
MSKQSIENIGYLYCFANETMPGIYKIGMTTRTPEIRLKEANRGTYVVPIFTIALAKKVTNVHKKEREIHKILAGRGKRISPKREFFRASLDEIQDLFDAIDLNGPADLNSAPSKPPGNKKEYAVTNAQPVYSGKAEADSSDSDTDSRDVETKYKSKGKKKTLVDLTPSRFPNSDYRVNIGVTEDVDSTSSTLLRESVNESTSASSSNAQSSSASSATLLRESVNESTSASSSNAQLNAHHRTQSTPRTHGTHRIYGIPGIKITNVIADMKDEIIDIRSNYTHNAESKDFVLYDSVSRSTDLKKICNSDEYIHRIFHKIISLNDEWVGIYDMDKAGIIRKGECYTSFAAFATAHFRHVRNK